MRGLITSMPLQYLSFRAFVHATENEDRVVLAMKLATGLDEFSRVEVDGHHGNPIVILEGDVRKKRDIRRFFSLMEGDDIIELLNSLEDRVEEDSHFYMRLDKQEAYLGRLRLAVDEDVIQVRGAVVSYPKNREAGLASMREFLQSFLDVPPSEK